MSIVPGAEKLKDPSSVKNVSFDWDTNYLAAAVEIVGQSVFVTGPDAVLTVDTVALMPGNRVVNCRVSGGTLNELYTLTCRITTNETPAQVDDRSIRIRIQQL